jgi:hypothetical protein
MSNKYRRNFISSAKTWATRHNRALFTCTGQAPERKLRERVGMMAICRTPAGLPGGDALSVCTMT